VQVDLGQRLAIEEVRLIPARPVDFADTPGFGFPPRFRVQFSDEPGFASPAVVSEHTKEDFKNPGDAPVTFAVNQKQAQFVRVTATRLWERSSDYAFALSELQVMVNALTLLLALRSPRSTPLTRGYGPGKSSWMVSTAGTNWRLLPLLPQTQMEGEIQALAEKRSQLAESLLDEATKKELADLTNRLSKINQEFAALPPPEMVYAAASDFKASSSFLPPKPPRPCTCWPRGDVKRPGELMQAAGVAAVPGPDPHCEIPDASNGVPGAPHLQNGLLRRKISLPAVRL